MHRINQGALATMTAESAGMVMTWNVGGIRGWLDRALAIGYGVVYDYVYPRFSHYQRLQAEVRELIEKAVPPRLERREVRVLDVGCGPGNFTCALAEAGFNATGLDSYGPLVGSAKSKRRARHLANLAFRQGELTHGNTFRDGAFDQVVSIHALYAHPAPERLLREAHRVLKPGGYAVFVNHTQRVGQWPTLREIARRDGAAAALQGLLWVALNSIFEATRERVGPHYWDEATFSARLGQAGFTVLDMRRTFLGGASLLVWARKSAEI
jgi:2-polyprenyl-3-methyl-5-hydroxy-6-metoxy-1,4-benzoquinol methylase